MAKEPQQEQLFLESDSDAAKVADRYVEKVDAGKLAKEELDKAKDEMMNTMAKLKKTKIHHRGHEITYDLKEVIKCKEMKPAKGKKPSKK